MRKDYEMDVFLILSGMIFAVSGIEKFQSSLVSNYPFGLINAILMLAGAVFLIFLGIKGWGTSRNLTDEG